MASLGREYAPDKRYDKYKVHSIPKGTMKKMFGLETRNVGFREQDSSFRSNKFASCDRNQPVGVFGKPGDGPNPKLDKYQIHSIPKETMKQCFGIETKKIGYAAQDSTFKFNKVRSDDFKPPVTHLGPNFDPSNHFDRFKLDSDVARKSWGQETKHLGFKAQDSTFAFKKMLSVDRNTACGVFGKPGEGPNHKLDKYKIHSIPKETMKKVFGIETKKIGYAAQDSTFRFDKVRSSDFKQPVTHFGSAFDPKKRYDKYMLHSLPPEIEKGRFGQETSHLPFHIGQQSALSKVGYTFGSGPTEAIRTSAEYTKVAADINYRQQLEKETKARLASGHDELEKLRQAAERAAAASDARRSKIAALRARKFCNGAWSFERIRGWIREKMQTRLRTVDTPMQEAFKMFGRPRAGVTAEIFAKAVRGWGLPVAADEAGELFSAFDMHGSGRVRFHDFMSLLLCDDLASPGAVPSILDKLQQAKVGEQYARMEKQRQQQLALEAAATGATAKKSGGAGAGGGGDGDDGIFALTSTGEDSARDAASVPVSASRPGTAQQTVARLIMTPASSHSGRGRAPLSMPRLPLPVKASDSANTTSAGAGDGAQSDWEPSTPVATVTSLKALPVGGRGVKQQSKSHKKPVAVPPPPAHMMQQQQKRQQSAQQQQSDGQKTQWQRPSTSMSASSSRPGTGASASAVAAMRAQLISSSGRRLASRSSASNRPSTSSTTVSERYRSALAFVTAARAAADATLPADQKFRVPTPPTYPCMRTFEPPWDRPNTTEQDEEMARAQQQVRAVPGPLGGTQTLQLEPKMPKSQEHSARTQGADGVGGEESSSVQLMGDAQVLVVEPPQRQEEPQQEPQDERGEQGVADTNGDDNDANAAAESVAGTGNTAEAEARCNTDGEGDAYDELGPSVSAREPTTSPVDDADALVQFVAEQLDDQSVDEAGADANAEVSVKNTDNAVALANNKDGADE